MKSILKKTKAEADPETPRSLLLHLPNPTTTNNTRATKPQKPPKVSKPINFIHIYIYEKDRDRERERERTWENELDDKWGSREEARDQRQSKLRKQDTDTWHCTPTNQLPPLQRLSLIMWFNLCHFLTSNCNSFRRRKVTRILYGCDLWDSELRSHFSRCLVTCYYLTKLDPNPLTQPDQKKKIGSNGSKPINDQ